MANEFETWPKCFLGSWLFIWVAKITLLAAEKSWQLETPWHANKRLPEEMHQMAKAPNEACKEARGPYEKI